MVSFYDNMPILSQQALHTEYLCTSKTSTRDSFDDKDMLVLTRNPTLSTLMTKLRLFISKITFE